MKLEGAVMLREGAALPAAATVRTTCPYCGVGCGVLAEPSGDGWRVKGDPDHPANRGRLCSKGAALAETIGLADRLLSPRIVERDAAGATRARDVSWDEALERVAAGFRDVIERHGPDSVALYVSGQLLTEDYYVANKLVKGWFGTGNIDTNSRLCMASAVAGHKRAFGEDIVPVSYEDLEAADLIVLVGSNAAWCHPVVYQRIMAAREARGTRLVVIDPRRTPTCDQADLHLPILPGADGLLFNGLLAYLAAHGAVDAAFVAARTEGLDAALAAARAEGDLAAIARGTGLDADKLIEFFEMFAGQPRVVTLFSQGINQSSSGTDKVNAIINCHLATGRIGVLGAGPFSITGQPNAMGGREVGGLANTLAAHLDLEDAAHRALVQDFWKSPAIAATPGPKAVELFEAVGDGRIKAIWIIATNPVVSLPAADVARAALERCEFVVVSDCVADTETMQTADVLLPGTAWGEKDGTVTNSERRISRQRAFLPAPGLARPDWWAICEVARRLGYATGFGFASAHEIFVEHARLSAAGNGAGSATPRFFSLEGLADLSAPAYDALRPVRWPVRAGRDGDRDGDGDGDGAADFMVPGRRARLVAVTARAPVHPATAAYRLTLNTGRVRDQWHTMTRTGRAPQLGSHRPEPYVEIHPEDVRVAGLSEGELARVSTAWGALVVRVVASADQRRGSIFIPIHWNGPFASDARVGAAVNPVVDPVSGEPEFKQTPAAIEPFAVDWYGFILSRQALETGDLAWWARSQGADHLRYEIAGRGRVTDWAAWARARMPGAGEWLDFSDAAAGVYRAARISDGRLAACLFVSPRLDLPARSWLAHLFAREHIAGRDRLAILAGRAGAGDDPGPNVCACFGVGRGAIVKVIRQGAASTGGIGAALKAGTNCGSCLPELRRLIAAEAINGSRAEAGAAAGHATAAVEAGSETA